MFHQTDIVNVVNILSSGELLSRTEMGRRGHQFIDSANPGVIARTDKRWKNYVRFYLRPRTPFLYDTEGFRPVNRRHPGGVHCPVPVYLLFDFGEIISRADTLFSNGNLAVTSTGRTQVFDKAEDFRRLPFDLIYHEGYFHPDERDEIINRRHAEVLVPQRVGLEALQRIWCRSQAEYETLRCRLGNDLWQRWKAKITDRTDYQLFYRYWIYVDSVIASDQKIRFNFHQCRHPEDSGPFHLHLQVREAATGQIYTSTSQQRTITGPLEYDLRNLKYPNNYTADLFIDGQVAYSGDYVESAEDLPF